MSQPSQPAAVFFAPVIRCFVVKLIFGHIFTVFLCKSSRKWNTRFLYIYLIRKVFLVYFIKIVYFDVLFRNYDNLLRFKFWPNICFFWRKLFCTWNHGCVKLWTLRWSASYIGGIIQDVKRLNMCDFYPLFFWFSWPFIFVLLWSKLPFLLSS